jgi:hypothetical protein
MRKLQVLLLVAAYALLASCDEIGPNINFQETIADPDDTSYVLSSAPAAQPRNVLLEEFTGVSCPNCPAGHEIVKSLYSSTQGRLVAVGLYQTNNTLTRPRPTTDDDFRLQLASDINATIYNGAASSLPIAGIDRKMYDNALIHDRSKWVGLVTSRLNDPTLVNLELKSTLNEAEKTIKVKITATFTGNVSKKVFLTAGITQDSIEDAQENGLQEIEDYEHEHVFRGLVTPNGVNGVELPSTGSYEAGRVFVRTFTYTIPPEMENRLKPGHCKVFVFAHHLEADTKEVLQATAVKMK